VLYVTERCVFALTADGLELVEVAPGVDIERDILQQMAFEPVIKTPPLLMDERIFRPGPMGLREDLLRVPLEQRFSYDPQENVLFINFEGLLVRTREDVEHIRRLVAERVEPLRRKVYVIVNYDNFSILPDVFDAYTDMVRDLSDRFYSGVTRYSTSGFLRMKLGDALAQRHVAPHIYESADEAAEHLLELERKAGV
jgi:propionate CoA-transferase